MSNRNEREIKVVMFDVGGVLTIGGKPGARAKLAGELMGLGEPISVPDLEADLKRGIIHNDEFVLRVNKRYPDAPRSLTDQIWTVSFDAKGTDHLAVALARRCAANGYRVGILSNVSLGSAAYLRANGHYDGFDPVLLSCDEGLAKPDPKFYRLAEERLPGIRPNEILFLDDQEKCCAAARAEGWRSIRVDTSEQLVRDVEILLGFA